MAIETKRVVGIVGARLNSSRLPRKQLLDLAGKPAIERIFERLEAVPEIDRLILATTADDYNRPLVEWARRAGREVFAFEGDVNDLTARADAIVQREQPDIVVYFCGDSPLIEPATVSGMLRKLAGAPDAHIAILRPHDGKPPIHEGIQLYSRAIWEWIAAHSESPSDKEHLGSAVHRHPDLRYTLFEDEPVYHAIKHRISVDTVSDYQFMSELYRRWYRENGSETRVSLRWVVHQLLADPELRAINGHVRQKGLLDASGRLLLAADATGDDGRLRLFRTVALARALQDYYFAGVSLLLKGPAVDLGINAIIPHRWLDAGEDLTATVVEERVRLGAGLVGIDAGGAAPPPEGAVAVDRLPEAEAFECLEPACIDGRHAEWLARHLVGDRARRP